MGKMIRFPATFGKPHSLTVLGDSSHEDIVIVTENSSVHVLSGVNLGLLIDAARAKVTIHRLLKYFYTHRIDCKPEQSSDDGRNETASGSEVAIK